MNCSVKSVEIAPPLWMRPEEPGGGIVIGLFCFVFWPFPHRIPRGQLSIPVKAQDFLKADLLEGVDLGRGESALTNLLCRGLILLSGYERVMFQAESEAAQRSRVPHHRDARCRLLLHPRWMRSDCAEHCVSDPRGSFPYCDSVSVDSARPGLGWSSIS